MCNYKESCEKPLLERMGNWDIFIAGLSSTVETDRSYSRGSIAVSARRSIAPPKSLWPNARTLKFPIVLSLQTYNLRHDPVLCCGEMSIAGILQGRKFSLVSQDCDSFMQ